MPALIDYENGGYLLKAMIFSRSSKLGYEITNSTPTTINQRNKK
jgi:hypothetical protein